MALDRSKFKATVVAKATEQDQEIAAALGKQRGGFTGYIRFEDGPNLLRIYPPHPEENGGGEVFAEPKVTIFLPMIVVERDANGNEIIENGKPKTKEGMRSVFNSKIHGGTDKDLVEEYVRMAIDGLEEAQKHEQDAKELVKIQDKLNRLKGNYALKIQGLNYNSKWSMYVDRIVGKTATFGTLDIGVAVKERLNSLAASADSDNNPLATDPFTDIEDGRAIIVTYNSKATKPQDYYKTELDSVMVDTVIGGKTYKMPRSFALTDEQLDAFMKVEPLKKRFVNVFSRRDFELQLEGLEYFDGKYQIGLFQDDQFISILEEIDSYYPEVEGAGGDEGEGNVGAISAEKAVETQEPDQDMFDLMDRKELADWHRTNKTGVIVKPTMKEEDLREMAREHLLAIDEEAQQETQTEVDEEQQTYDENDVDDVTEEVEQTTQTTTQSRIAAMRAKAGVPKGK